MWAEDGVGWVGVGAGRGGNEDSREKVANKAAQVLLLRDVKCKNANENKCAHST